jgi:hypothetical protein
VYLGVPYAFNDISIIYKKKYHSKTVLQANCFFLKIHWTTRCCLDLIEYQGMSGCVGS